MRSLDDARRRGRECRAEIDLRTEETLLERLIGFIEEKHEFFPEAVHPNQLGTDKALLDKPNLWYDERLYESPANLILQLAHELGHLEQHPRVKTEPHQSRAVNPLASAPYLEHQDTVAVARYSTRSLEEAEATAFAIDFLCPSDRLYNAWRTNPGVPLAVLAGRFDVSLDVARVQLAAAVFEETSVIAHDNQRDESYERFENCAQERAIVWPEKEPFDERRPLLIDAGPGTGKTDTLVRRAVYLIESGQATAGQILILTFSNEASFELKDRLRDRLHRILEPEQAQQMMIATFHGFGRHLLHYLGGRFTSDIPGKVPVLDQASQEDLVLDLVGRADAAHRFGPVLKLNDLGKTAAETVRHINHLKQRLWTPKRLRKAIADDDVAEKDRPTFLALAELYEAYEAEKSERGVVDFADLILLPIRLLTEPEHIDAADVVRATYPHVLVDEFQDVSEATGRLLKALCTDAQPPWVVGDARQSIFRFLGAHPSNVSEFLETYPKAERIELDLNYRSCAEIVAVNNTLAALMEDPSPGLGLVRERWRAMPGKHSPFGEMPVAVAVANSDASERAGIAVHVQRIIDSQVPAEDIAVLARRNVDVREIAVALGKLGVEVATCGFVTPEGASGDLLAAAASRDARATSISRLATALGRERYGVTTINAAVRSLLGDGDGPAGGDVIELIREVEDVLEGLRTARGIPDAFGLISVFLFEASDYTRRILDAPASAIKTMALAEIATTLSEAALYRFSHQGIEASKSRRGFVAYFERKLSEGTPSRIAPSKPSGAVQIMTTHASKGLQFPHVIVAGQTMPLEQYWNYRSYKWIPNALRPARTEDLGQADSLLFVGVSRAQRSLVVSYAETASARENAKQRPPPPILENWSSTDLPATWRWPSTDPEADIIKLGRVWGGSAQKRMGASSFKSDACSIKAYLGDELEMNLPEADHPLYPVFFGKARTVLGSLVELAHDGGRALTQQDALDAVSEHWPPETASDHRHLPMFTELITDAALGFAEVYLPLATEHIPLDLDRVESSLGDPSPGLHFCSAFLDDAGRAIVILIRPESLKHGISKRKGGLNPSAKGLETELIRVTVLRELYSSVTTYVYSVNDRVLYEWHAPGPPRKGQKPTGERIMENVVRTQEMFTDGQFVHEISDFQCGRCRRRVFCPYWTGLAEM